MYICKYAHGNLSFVSCTETMKGGPAHNNCYLALPWAIPYPAKRGMLGATRRGSRLQAAHDTD